MELLRDMNRDKTIFPKPRKFSRCQPNFTPISNYFVTYAHIHQKRGKVMDGFGRSVTAGTKAKDACENIYT